MTPEDAFFAVHAGLPRQGPGMPGDVAWALGVAGTPDTARICDAGCGPGADTVTLAELRPQADILAVDLHGPFVEQASANTVKYQDRVQAEVCSYTSISGPFDLIWCAGAIYFVGIEAALQDWRSKLTSDGAVAFSEPAWTSATPSDSARAFWADYPAMSDVDTLRSRLGAANWRLLGERWIDPEGWPTYYEPMRKRLDLMRSQSPNEVLSAAIRDAQREIDAWAAAREEIAYRLFVVAPA